MKHLALVSLLVLSPLASGVFAEEAQTPPPPRRGPVATNAAAPRANPPAPRSTQTLAPSRNSFGPRGGVGVSPVYRNFDRRAYGELPAGYGRYNPRATNPTAEQPDYRGADRAVRNPPNYADVTSPARVISSNRPGETATTVARRNRNSGQSLKWDGGPAGILTRDGRHFPRNGEAANGRDRDDRSRDGYAGRSDARNRNGGSRSYSDVLRNYRHERHDRNWWRSHHERFVLFGGGYYYWDAGYWFPAWGYDAGYSNYTFDGPIYGYDGLAPDEVISRVQSALQEEGYYRDAVDGELGPNTRAAIAAWQRDHGLAITTVIDEPTIASLGL